MSPVKPSTILMVDADPDDHASAREAFAKGGLPGDFPAVEDGAWRLDFNLRKKAGGEISRETRAAPISIVS